MSGVNTIIRMIILFNFLMELRRIYSEKNYPSNALSALFRLVPNANLVELK